MGNLFKGKQSVDFEKILEKIILFIEPIEMYRLFFKINNITFQLFKSSKFQEKIFKINFSSHVNTIDFMKENIIIVKRMKIFEKYLINNKNLSKLKDFTTWTIKQGLDLLLDRILFRLEIKKIIRDLIPFSNDVVLFRMDINRNDLIQNLDPNFLIYTSIIENQFQCFITILKNFDGPLYHLKNPDYLFVNSYYERRAPIHTCTFHGKLQFLQYLNKNGAKMTLVESRYGQTILHIATIKQHLDIIKHILEEKIVDVNSKDTDGFSPLSLVFEQSETSKNIKQLLEKYGGIDHKDFHGYSKKKEKLKIRLKTIESKIKNDIIQKVIKKPLPNCKWRSFNEDEFYKLQNYKKGLLLGAGAYGKVYLAIKKEKEIVALKEISCDTLEKTNKCIQECINAIKFDHPNILKYNDYFNTLDEEEGFKVYIETDFCKLGDLSNFIKNYGMDEGLILEFCKQILFGIDYIHQKNMVHRDLKPQNILLKLNEMNNDFILLIGDFGETKSVSTMKNGGIAGTPQYIAPYVGIF